MDDILRAYNAIQPEQTNTSKNEQALERLGKLPEWDELKKLIVWYKSELDALLNILDTDTVEVIGMKYLVARTTANYLQAIIDSVEQQK